MCQNLMFLIRTQTYYIILLIPTQLHSNSLATLVVPKWLSVSSGCILALLRWVSSLHGSLFPHLTVSLVSLFNMLQFLMDAPFLVFSSIVVIVVNLFDLFFTQLSSEDMIAEFSQVLNW